MTKEATEIEVEVVEIDGVTPVAPQTREEEHRSQNDWRQWQGRVRQLDSRWWPLWVVLGLIALMLILTVGLVLGVIFVIVRLCMKLARAVMR